MISATKTHATARIEVKSYQPKAHEKTDVGPELVEIHVSETFVGDIEYGAVPISRHLDRHRRRPRYGWCKPACWSPLRSTCDGRRDDDEAGQERPGANSLEEFPALARPLPVWRWCVCIPAAGGEVHRDVEDQSRD